MQVKAKYHRIFWLALGSILIVGLMTSCSKTAAAYLKKGDDFFAQKKYQDALLNYRNAIQKESNSAEAHYKVGLTEQKLNNKRAMIAYWQEALKLQPQQDSWRVALSDQLFDIYLKDSKRPKAISDELISNYAYLIKKDSASLDGNRLKGQLALLEGRIPEAIEAFETALKSKPGNSPAAMGRAQSLLRSGDPAQVLQGEKALLEWIDREPTNATLYEALFVHYASTGRDKLGEEVLRSKMEKNPGNPNAYSQFADYLVNKKRVAEADEVIQKMTASGGKEQARAYAIAGEYFSRQRRFIESRKQFETAIERAPERRRELQNRIGLLLINSGDINGAFEYLNQLLKNDPSNGEALAIRATLAIDTNRAESALTDARQLIKSDPKNPQFGYLLGRALAANGDEAGARGYFARNAQADPNDVASRVELSKLSLSSGSASDAVRIATEILDKSPNQAAALLIRAQAHTRTMELEKARTDLRLLLKLRPDSAEAQIQFAYTDALSNRGQAAEKVFASFYRPGQQNLRPLEGLILVAKLEGKTQKVLALLEQEIKLRPEQPQIAAMLAEEFLRKGDYAMAMQTVQRAMLKNPKEPSLLLACSRALSEAGKLEDAEKVARELLAQAKLPQSVCTARLAEVLQLQGRNAEAITLYRTLLKDESQNVVFLNNLGFLLAEQNQDLSQAKDLAERALKLAPNDPQILDTLALIEIQAGRPAKAIKLLSPLTGKVPGDAGQWYHLGLAQSKMGLAKDARKSLESALKFSPTQHQSNQIREALKTL